MKLILLGLMALLLVAQTKMTIVCDWDGKRAEIRGPGSELNFPADCTHTPRHTLCDLHTGTKERGKATCTVCARDRVTPVHRDWNSHILPNPPDETAPPYTRHPPPRSEGLFPFMERNLPLVLPWLN